MPAQSAASAVEHVVDDDSDVYYDDAEDTGAYYTDKLTFSTIYPSKFGMHIIQRYVLYSNFYSKHSVKGFH